MQTYRVYWINGDVEVIRGRGILNALVEEGYTAGAYKALDHHEIIEKHYEYS